MYDIDHVWVADLKDMMQYHKDNDDYKFVVMVMDVFSRYMWAVPLKTKQSIEISKALEKIFKDTGRKPRILFTDAGSEFVGRTRKMLADNDIKHVVSRNETKVPMIERNLGTIFKRLFRYFTLQNSLTSGSMAHWIK